jgi:hypothetical protein
MNKSPWEIGASHWNQRDLYTQNARTDDGGYGLGPAVHPEEGSYAYPRGESPAEERDEDPAHVAWPILRLHLSDEEIHREVRLALDVRSGLSAKDIDIAVADAVVTLSGEVPNDGQRRRAVEIAAGCRGVASVTNKLRIKNESSPFDPLALVIPSRMAG